MGDRRRHLRFDKVFTVYISTPDGMTRGIGRNISARRASSSKRASRCPWAAGVRR